MPVLLVSNCTRRDSLLGELEQTDLSNYRHFMRMDSTSFRELLSKVAPVITKRRCFVGHDKLRNSCVILCNSCSSLRHISCYEARGAPCARADSENLIGEYLEHRKTSSDFCCRQQNPRTSSNMFDDVQGHFNACFL